MNTPVKSAVITEDEHPIKRQKNAGKVDHHRKKKSIEVVDNVNLARNSVVTTPTVATEADMNEIVIVGCSETDPLVCESGYIKVYESRNTSYSMSKLKEKMSRIEVEKCMKAEANTFTIENRVKFPPPLIFNQFF